MKPSLGQGHCGAWPLHPVRICFSLVPVPSSHCPLSAVLLLLSCCSLMAPVPSSLLNFGETMSFLRLEFSSDPVSLKAAVPATHSGSSCAGGPAVPLPNVHLAHSSSSHRSLPAITFSVRPPSPV